MVFTRAGKSSKRSNRASKPSKLTAPVLPGRLSDRLATGLGSPPCKRRIKTLVHLSFSSTSSGSSSDDDASTPAPSAPPHAEPGPSSAQPSASVPGPSSSPTPLAVILRNHSMQGDNDLPTKEIEEEEATKEIEDEEVEVDEKRYREKAGTSCRRRRLLGRGENYSAVGYDIRKLPEGIEEFLPSRNLYFVTKLRKSREAELAIPHELSDNLKLRDSIQFEDPEGRLWEGTVAKWRDGRVWIKHGWKKLCKWNKVSANDTLICEFLPSQKSACEVIRVQIIRPRS